MGRIQLGLTIETDGDTERMAALVAEYLTHREMPFIEDYGYGAWGGYEGPFVVACTVVQDGKVLGTYENRTKPEEDE